MNLLKSLKFATYLMAIASCVPTAVSAKETTVSVNYNDKEYSFTVDDEDPIESLMEQIAEELHIPINDQVLKIIEYNYSKYDFTFIESGRTLASYGEDFELCLTVNNNTTTTVYVIKIDENGKQTSEPGEYKLTSQRTIKFLKEKIVEKLELKIGEILKSIQIFGNEKISSAQALDDSFSIPDNSILYAFVKTGDYDSGASKTAGSSNEVYYSGASATAGSSSTVAGSDKGDRKD